MNGREKKRWLRRRRRKCQLALPRSLHPVTRAGISQQPCSRTVAWFIQQDLHEKPLPGWMLYAYWLACSPFHPFILPSPLTHSPHQKRKERDNNARQTDTIRRGVMCTRRMAFIDVLGFFLPPSLLFLSLPGFLRQNFLCMKVPF